MRTRGFTLLEVLLAIGVLLVLSAMVISFFLTLVDRRDRLGALLADSEASSLSLRWLERDLLTCVASSGGQAGIRGEPTELTVVSRSVVVPMPQDAADGKILGDAQRLRVVWSRQTGELTIERGEADGVMEADVLSQRVRWLQFRYHDGSGWRGSFNSGAEGRLPSAVEIAIWFGEPVVDESAPPLGQTATGGSPEDDAAMGRPRNAATEPGMLLEEPMDPFGGAPTFGVQAEPPTGRPDRWRVIVIPDAPEAGWEGSR